MFKIIRNFFKKIQRKIKIWRKLKEIEKKAKKNNPTSTKIYILDKNGKNHNNTQITFEDLNRKVKLKQESSPVFKQAEEKWAKEKYSPFNSEIANLVNLTKIAIAKNNQAPNLIQL